MEHERISPALVKVGTQIWHFCPACKIIHQFAIDKPFPNGAKWKLSGTPEKPTFTPSMNISAGKPPYLPQVCHYVITDGMIEYCIDCTHAFAGTTVVLPHIPEYFWSAWK